MRETKAYNCAIPDTTRQIILGSVQLYDFKCNAFRMLL